MSSGQISDYWSEKELNFGNTVVTKEREPMASNSLTTPDFAEWVKKYKALANPVVGDIISTLERKSVHASAYFSLDKGRLICACVKSEIFKEDGKVVDSHWILNETGLSGLKILIDYRSSDMPVFHTVKIVGIAKSGKALFGQIVYETFGG